MDLLLRNVWSYVESCCSDVCSQRVTISCKDVILGYNYDIQNKNIFVNKIILYCKYYIWNCKIGNQLPSTEKFKVVLDQHKMFE